MTIRVFCPKLYIYMYLSISPVVDGVDVNGAAAAVAGAAAAAAADGVCFFSLSRSPSL